MAHFSSNTITGACASCKGVGETISIDFTLLLNEEKTMIEGGVTLWDTKLAKYYENIILAARKHYNFSFDTTTPLKNYTQKQKDFLLYGSNHPNFVKEYKNSKSPKKVSEGSFEGIIPPLLALYKKNPLKASQDIKKYILHESCTECNATGLAPLGRTVTVSGKTINDITQLSLSEFLDWLYNLDTALQKDDASILTAVSGALKERTSNLIEVGLHYVRLDRTVPSLSAGEAQRLRLASLLASGLCGVLYVLDEPTTGLHPHDTAKLLKTIRKIQQTGNTVLVIEHDLDVIRNVDYILEIGPEGGSKGGKIIASGTPEELMANTKSITGHYLNKKSPLPLNTATRKKETLTVRGAHEHNLKNIDVSIPLQQFVVITGVSGSGKSTFLFDIVDKAARNYLNNANEIPGKHKTIEGLENFNRIVTVDQRAIGSTKSSRSNVATYTKLFDYIRNLFATLPEAKKRNFSAESFSFNTSDQRCQNCNGAGIVEVDMTFMPDIQKECPVCDGTRFNEDILAVQFKGYNIADILAMPVSDAIAVFKHEKKILALLELMQHIGLDYLALGQSTSTLSGGEAQRIKLAAELAKSETGNTLYLLDEPTTGLHPQEVEKLLTILKKLVTQGNTVVVIEHNLEIIAHADTIIDFGPGGGIAGGTIVTTGTPQEVMQSADSLTGKALKAFINN